MTLRLGIVGCGLIGAKRAEAARACGVKVSIVADTDDGRAQALAARFGAAPSRRWQDVIDADIDIVNVAVTHDLLAPIATAAVKAGKHVLVEKPGARTPGELMPLLDAAAGGKRLVKVGFNHRFHPAVLRAKEIVDSGSLGPLMFLRGRYGHGGRVGYEKEWRFNKAVSGGGELLDQGSHLIDLSRWFLGEVRLAYAATPTYFWNAAVEDNAFLALQGEANRMAWLHASWSEWKNIFSLEIYGRDGKLSLEGLGGSYGVERLTYYKMLPGMGPPETTSWEFPFPDNSWVTELREFVDAIVQSREPIGNGADALAVLDLVDQAYRRDQ